MTRSTRTARRIRTAAIAVGLAAVILPASASAYVPNRGEAIDSMRSLMHDSEVAESVLTYGYTTSLDAPDAGGHFIKGNLVPKATRTRHGWKSSAVIYTGTDRATGTPLHRLGTFRIVGFRGGYSTTFVPYPKAR